MKKRTVIFAIMIIGILIWLIGSNWRKDNFWGEKKQNPAVSPTSNILITDSGFEPSALTVVVGTKITWKNQDEETHEIISDNNKFKSTQIEPGQSFEFVFNELGTYDYHCDLKPKMKGMVEIIKL